jgi:hypothetical protein
MNLLILFLIITPSELSGELAILGAHTFKLVKKLGSVSRSTRSAHNMSWPAILKIGAAFRKIFAAFVHLRFQDCLD